MPSAKRKAAHTPGPWTTEPGISGDWLVQGPGGSYIAQVDDAEDSDNKTNARLIAAAPELLACCKKAAELIASYHAENGGFSDGLNELMDVIRRAEGSDAGEGR